MELAFSLCGRHEFVSSARIRRTAAGDGDLILIEIFTVQAADGDNRPRHQRRWK